METNNSKIKFSFEAGSDRKDIIEYTNRLKEKMRGKVPDEDIDSLVESILSSKLVTKCDACDLRIPEHEKLLNYTFKCSNCKLKYDLCFKCNVQGHSTNYCPPTFGCQRLIDDVQTTKIFIPKHIENPLEMYNTELSTLLADREEGAMLNKIFDCSRFPISLLHFKKGKIPPRLFEDLWKTFRYTSEGLRKYGEPEYERPYVPNYQVNCIYQQLAPSFDLFINMKNPNGNSYPKFLKILYPNEDAFFIKAPCYEEEFLTFFIPLSEYFPSNFFEEYKDYDLDTFKEDIRNFSNHEDSPFMIVELLY
ncbi:MAG TPA: hypothetical protein PKD85_01850 [Saprospiraceae bacterium]|nr:hypothetical protein [Saprospiraceae bacterium]